MLAYVGIRSDGYCIFKTEGLDLVFKISNTLKHMVRIVSYEHGLITAICDCEYNGKRWQDEEYFDVGSVLTDLGIGRKCIKDVKGVMIYES